MKISIFLLIFFTLGTCNKNVHKQDMTVIIGDSLVANQPIDRGPQGWGFYMESEDTINKARSGSSSVSFYKDFWPKIISQKPKIVIIQFGYNDVKKDYRYADPETDFKECLRNYVIEASAVGTKVVLVTPPQRLIGKDVSPYAQSTIEIAEEMGVQLVNLFEFSVELQKKYNNNIKLVYNDGSHTNNNGAKIYAEFVKDSIQR